MAEPALASSPATHVWLEDGTVTRIDRLTVEEARGAVVRLAGELEQARNDLYETRRELAEAKRKLRGVMAGRR